MPAKYMNLDELEARAVCRVTRNGCLQLALELLLERNLIYTGITRSRKFLVVVGQKKALGMAVRNGQSRKRYSGLLGSLKETGRSTIA